MQLERTILLIFLLGQTIDGAFMANTALIDDISAVADGAGKIQVLFGQQNGDAFGPQPLNRLNQLFDDARRQPSKRRSRGPPCYRSIMFGRNVASFGKRIIKNTTTKMEIKKGKIPR